MSHVRCCVSGVIFRMSLTATATDPLPAKSPSMHSIISLHVPRLTVSMVLLMILTQTQQLVIQTPKLLFYDYIWANIANSETNTLQLFSRHRPSGPMLSISRFVRPSVCVCVRLFVCSLLRYRLTVFLPPLPEVGCPIFLEIWNPSGKVMERSGLRYEHFSWKIV